MVWKRDYASAAYSDVATNTTGIPFTISVHVPAVFPGCVLKGLHLHEARGYCVKLQCQGYTEQCMTDNYIIL